MRQRCSWPKNERNIKYHDEEWGIPVFDDRRHFEFLTLESAQAGLSWDTVLKKREAYREAFCNFEPFQVAAFTEANLQALVLNPGLIRHPKKMAAAVGNAQLFLKIQSEFGTFSDYIWRFVGGKPICNTWERMDQVPASSPESDALSKDMKKRGFKFVGSIICYSHLQAAGLINDHLVDCFRYEEIRKTY